MKKKIILFGAGTIGRQVFQILTDSEVCCFCDNNKEIAGTYRYGKKVISFDELKEIHDKYIIVICANYIKSYAITTQLEDNKIYDYIPFVLLREEYKKEEYENIFNDECIRNHIRIKFFRKIAADFKLQVSYFMQHADIGTFKQATGELRKHQEKEADWLKDVLIFLEPLKIKPILYAGNLLGYVRHNGFIPWDDDIDVLLIRDDYEKVRDFCIQNISDIYKKGWGFYGNAEYFLIRRNDCDVDFFSMDFYRDDYLYRDFRNYLTELKHKRLLLENDISELEFIRTELKDNSNIVSESSKLYFGIDNMDAYALFDIGEWIEKETVYPLKYVSWEGIEIYIPNKPEKFLSYLYKDIYSFPDDVGLPKHEVLWNSEV